MVGYWIDK